MRPVRKENGQDVTYCRRSGSREMKPGGLFLGGLTLRSSFTGCLWHPGLTFRHLKSPGVLPRFFQLLVKYIDSSRGPSLHRRLGRNVVFTIARLSLDLLSQGPFLIFLQLRAHLLQYLADQPGDVHLRDLQFPGDLELGHSLEEAHVDYPLFSFG